MGFRMGLLGSGRAHMGVHVPTRVRVVGVNWEAFERITGGRYEN